MGQLLTRAEGYRRGSGKEALGISTVHAFLDQRGIPTHLIEGAEDNYRLGDLMGLSGQTVEVKRQPIDPARYRRNYVEVAELTSNPRHDGGHGALAELLGLADGQLASVRCRQPDGRVGQLGWHQYVSVSVRSIFAARFTIYVNPGEKGAGHLYVYERQEIGTAIRTAVRAGVTRGAGNSNQDTLGVTIPLPCHRWTRPSPAAPWVYCVSPC